MAAAVSTTMMEIGAETTAGDDDRILEIQAVILVIVRRNQATHRHRHHLRPPHRQTDIHEGHTTADNPPPPTLGAGLLVVPYVMFNGLRDSDPEQLKSMMGAPTQKNSFKSTPQYSMLPEQTTTHWRTTCRLR